MRLLLAFLLLMGAFFVRADAQTTDVDVALVLVVDVSGSVDEPEFALQRAGIAAAFANPEVIRAIEGGAMGKIAVTVIDFATEASVAVPWQLISGRESAEAFAALVLKSPKATYAGMTSISMGMTRGIEAIEHLPYRATRRVIDVSGDGSNNQDGYSDTAPVNMGTVRDLVIEHRIVVNGLPILGEEDGVEAFYQEWVITRGGFIITAKDTFDFARALRRKLVLEISELRAPTRGAVF